MALQLSSDEMQRDPYAVYATLRKEPGIRPVSMGMSETGTSLMVTRYEDAVAILKDARFSNEHRKIGGKDLTKAWWTPHILRTFLSTMVMVDDPAHARLRGLVHKAFTPVMIQKMTAQIEAITVKLLDDAARKPVVDLMADFALPLPLTVISEMLGVPDEDRLKFHHWTAGLMDTTNGSGSKWSIVSGIPNAFFMNRFFNRLITQRRSDPQDDLISALIQATEEGDRLSNDELLAMLFLLLFAGHETTVNLIGNGTLALLENPDQLEKLRADPSLMDATIEEILRYTNPVQHIAPRFALEDVDLNGQHIPRGSHILINIASANRDDTFFKDADHFDIARSPNRHIAFGLGIHYCVGAPLARMEGKIALTRLLERAPNLRLAVPANQLEWRRSSSLRGLRALPVKF